MTSINRVAIVGAGTIGAGWAAHFLGRGLEVVAWDPDPAAEARLRRMLEPMAATLAAAGLLAEGARFDRLRFEHDLPRALDGADFVQESGPERIDLKEALFRDLDAGTPPHVLLASSSSGLMPSEIQAFCAHPERCLVGHPFNPPHLVPLVEVVPGRQTSAEAVERAVAFYRAVGKHPIVLHKEVRGHVANRLQAAVWREVVHLHLEGVASIADLDAAMTYGPGMRWAFMGPSTVFHLGGGEGGIGHFLEHLGDAMQSWWDALGHPNLDPEVRRSLKAAIEEATAGLSIPEAARRRDTFLAELGALVRKLSPDAPQA